MCGPRHDSAPVAMGNRTFVSTSPQPSPSTTPAPELPAGPVVSLTDAVVLKDGAVFLVCMRDGTVPARGEHPLGLYLDDCRFLSAHELEVEGEAPRLLIASAET